MIDIKLLYYKKKLANSMNYWLYSRFSWPRGVIVTNAKISNMVANESLKGKVESIGIVDTDIKIHVFSFPVGGNDYGYETVLFFNLLLSFYILLWKFKNVLVWFKRIRFVNQKLYMNQFRGNSLSSFSKCKSIIDKNMMLFSNYKPEYISKFKEMTDLYNWLVLKNVYYFKVVKSWFLLKRLKRKLIYYGKIKKNKKYRKMVKRFFIYYKYKFRITRRVGFKGYNNIMFFLNRIFGRTYRIKFCKNFTKKDLFIYYGINIPKVEKKKVEELIKKFFISYETKKNKKKEYQFYYSKRVLWSLVFKHTIMRYLINNGIKKKIVDSIRIYRTDWFRVFEWKNFMLKLSDYKLWKKIKKKKTPSIKKYIINKIDVASVNNSLHDELYKIPYLNIYFSLYNILKRKKEIFLKNFRYMCSYKPKKKYIKKKKVSIIKKKKPKYLILKKTIKYLGFFFNFNLFKNVNLKWLNKHIYCGRMRYLIRRNTVIMKKPINLYSKYNSIWIEYKYRKIIK